jgi:mevalonate pyrophosphate decarboxylase
MISLPNPIKTIYTDISSDNDMTATITKSETFAEFCATADARNTIELNIRKWTLMLCDALLDNYKSRHGSDYKFYIESGRKYHKIIMDANGSRSVHAFVDKKTGEVYKPASFKAPAKHVRFNLCLIKDREWLLENADWAGGYLYMK